jgi:hypothetical protein
LEKGDCINGKLADKYWNGEPSDLMEEVEVVTEGCE